MTDLPTIWTTKTDEEVSAAGRSLADYTGEGEATIRAELRRRGLPEPPPPTGFCSRCGKPVDGDASSKTCSQCGKHFAPDMMERAEGKTPSPGRMSQDPSRPWYRRANVQVLIFFSTFILVGWALSWPAPLVRVLLSGLTGAVAGAVGIPLARAFLDPKKEPTTYRVLLACLVFATFYVADHSLWPAIRAWKAGRDAMAYFNSEPVFRALMADDPTLGQSFRDAVLSAAESGDTAAIQAQAKALVANALPRYLPKASDRAVVQFGTVLAKVLRRLASRDPDLCYRWLYPNADGPSKIEPPAVQDEQAAQLLDAMRAVIGSARDNGLAAPTRAIVDIDGLVRRIMTDVSAKHGDDMALLQRPATPGIERAKVCTVMTELYEETIRLPEAQAGAVIRVMFSPS